MNRRVIRVRAQGSGLPVWPVTGLRPDFRALPGTNPARPNFRTVRSVPDTEREAVPTLEDAERASHDLKDQLARARGIIGKYREMLTTPPHPAGDLDR